MESYQNNEKLHEDVEKNVSSVKIVECPNCKESVPLSIYCLKCGFPMFDLMKEHQRKDTEKNDDDVHTELSEIDVDSSSNHSTKIEFRLEPTDLDLKDMDDEELDADLEHEMNMEEKDKILDVDNDVKIVDSKDELYESNSSVSLNTSNVFSETQSKSSRRNGNVKIQKHGFDPDEATQNIMKNLANSINLKLWSIGQLLDEKISKENFVKLHEGYDDRYRQLMEQRNERLEHALDVNKLEEDLERAYICKSELEVRKTLNDLFEGEYQAKAPAYEWEISHCEILLENRKGEIAFLKNIENVVKRDELVNMVKTAKNYLEKIQSSDGLIELNDGTYTRLKTSMEEIVALLDESE